MLCPKTIYFVELSDMPWKTFPDKSAAVKISIIIIPAGQPILVLDSKWTMKEKTLKSDEGVSTIAEITRLQSHIINYSQCCSCIKAVDCRCGNETTNNMLYTFISVICTHSAEQPPCLKQTIHIYFQFPFNRPIIPRVL